ncbi:alanine racemase [Campylobacter sp. US33a]|uniref:Alanine racemase n=1 Tax=Campylobacter sp. CCS1377 TaxID=3158229 RepID=A0AAU7E8B2_9BACT|nr:alanine racemase [Campylobacter sp. US33a]MCW1360731.1 alanine racemase [Campylobacter jejuni]TEY04079.1 alanine racemase [Campylobacter sp. US33a]
MSLIRLKKSAYEHNLKQIAQKAGGFEKIICVLKNNAYGHGVSLLAPIAKQLGVNFVAVKNEREALELKNLFDNILILSHLPHGKENENFIYALNDASLIQNFKKKTKIHLVIDTNMHRNGIALQDLEQVFLKANEYLDIQGAFTHFYASDEIDANYFIQKQNFQSAKKKLYKISPKKLIFHSHNSSALFRCEKLDDDELCRVGLVQFGYGEFSQNLQKVLSLYANRLSSRILKTGQSVGYGGAFIATKDIKIATYDLGYADGLFRYDGKGDLFLANKEKILGKMSMDSFSCKDCGDEICVFEDAKIWAEFFHTIDYEILSKLSPYIKRVLV